MRYGDVFTNDVSKVITIGLPVPVAGEIYTMQALEKGMRIPRPFSYLAAGMLRTTVYGGYVLGMYELVKQVV